MIDKFYYLQSTNKVYTATMPKLKFNQPTKVYGVRLPAGHFDEIVVKIQRLIKKYTPKAAKPARKVVARGEA